MNTKISDLLSSYDVETFQLGVKLLDEDFFKWLANSNSTFKYDFDKIPRYVNKYLREFKLMAKSPIITLPSSDTSIGFAYVGYLSDRNYEIRGRIFELHEYTLRVDIINIVAAYENQRTIN